MMIKNPSRVSRVLNRLGKDQVSQYSNGRLYSQSLRMSFRHCKVRSDSGSTLWKVSVALRIANESRFPMNRHSMIQDTSSLMRALYPSFRNGKTPIEYPKSEINYMKGNNRYLLSDYVECSLVA